MAYYLVRKELAKEALRLPSTEEELKITDTEVANKAVKAKVDTLNRVSKCPSHLDQNQLLHGADLQENVVLKRGTWFNQPPFSLASGELDQQDDTSYWWDQ